MEAGRLSRAADRYTSSLRLLNRDARLFLLIGVFCGLTVSGGIYSVLLNLYLLRLGYGPPLVGLINAARMFTLAIVSLIAVAIGDRWRNRPMMIAGLALAVAGHAILPVAEWMAPTVQEAWLVAVYGLAWLGMAMYLVNSNPFLMDVTTPEERSHAFSLRSALLPLAAFAGSLAGGLLPGLMAALSDLSLDGPAPYRISLWIGALLFMPAVLAMLATGRGGVGHSQALSNVTGPMPLRLITIMSLVWFLWLAGMTAASVFFNVYLDAGLHVSTARIGMLLAAGQLAGVPAALAVPLLAERWGHGRSFTVGSLLLALSLSVMALVPHWAAAGLGYMGVQGLLAATGVAISIHQLEAVSAGWRTTMSGATSMAGSLGMFLMSLLGSYIIPAMGYPSLFLTGAGLAAAGALVFWLVFLTPWGLSFVHTAGTHL